MIQRQYPAGDVLFDEGDPSDFTCRIVSGTAEVVKRNHGEDVILGTAKVGDFIGEMGVIEARPRNAMVRAATDLVVEIYPRDVFLTRISEDNQLAFRLLVRLSERLKVLSQAFAEAVTSDEIRREDRAPKTNAGTEIPALSILADSDYFAHELPEEGLRITFLPFLVGRRSRDVTARHAFPVDLAIDDQQPYRISRTHFSIDMADGACIVRDMHSTLGTEVNGQGLGDQFTADRAPLNGGENLIIAGGHGSPYRFRVVLGDTDRP